eukprot:CAMPEP_0181291744 /NCGR_PEP_ID=MMETSP1101-20121128/2134_1 /TAXON_ID=46948 /ORGANISM="Rhodomonas abbreviata, Strain Caron Lab Isolate" /LENGTH=120 /DNA_ID=CAMNT_0023396163 /DNA_START=11 /DNA_END=373 /DNA_ORIENTATION=-
MAIPPNGWVRYDMQTGEKNVWKSPPGQYVDEAVVVPKKQQQQREGARAEDDDDDDGAAWLVGTVFCAQRKRSGLVVLDAARIEDGPVCRMWARDVMPETIHGCFSPRAFFPEAAPSREGA